MPYRGSLIAYNKITKSPKKEAKKLLFVYFRGKLRGISNCL